MEFFLNGKITFPKSKFLKSNKFKKNEKRDRINSLKLKKIGWKVYTFWECRVRKTKKLEKLSLKFPKQIDKLDAFFFDKLKYRSSVRHDATL